MAVKPKLNPLLDEPPPPHIATALAALHHGRADEHQQRNALDWIVRHACKAFSTTFDSDPFLSGFKQGRRQAGLIIINATSTSPKAAEALEDLSKEGSN
jgi:hypothetical protein